MLTLQQLKLPVKLVVFNNGALAFVELEMKAAGLQTYGTELEDPNLASIAEAIGLRAQRVEHPDDLEDALRTALEHEGPALIEAMVARQELSMPPKIKFEEIKGFTLYATRTILSGRGDEIIDLAATNVARRIFS